MGGSMSSFVTTTEIMKKIRADLKSVRERIKSYQVHLTRISEAKEQLLRLVNDAYDHGLTLSRADCVNKQNWRGPTRDQGVAKYNQSQTYSSAYYWSLAALLEDLAFKKDMYNGLLFEAQLYESELMEKLEYYERLRYGARNGAPSPS
jgi:hypothetical protein